MARALVRAHADAKSSVGSRDRVPNIYSSIRLRNVRVARRRWLERKPEALQSLDEGIVVSLLLRLGYAIARPELRNLQQER
jgi:hypothetical protein